MMFKLKRVIWLGIAVALLQSGVLYAMVEQRAAILRNGTDITLLTEPVDPRDFLRGDYVTLGYGISNIAVDKIAGTPPDAYEPAEIYISVKKVGEDRWEFASASWQKRDNLPEGEIELKGQTVSFVDSASYKEVHVTYGIERYYIPEGQGRAIEDQQRERKIEAVIAVSGTGEAQIRALKDDGKVLYDEPIY